MWKIVRVSEDSVLYIYWYHARAMHGLIKELYINFKKYIFRLYN